MPRQIGSVIMEIALENKIIELVPIEEYSCNVDMKRGRIKKDSISIASERRDYKKYAKN